MNFDGDIFLIYIEKTIVLLRYEVSFELKCGLHLKGKVD